MSKLRTISFEDGKKVNGVRPSRVFLTVTDRDTGSVECMGHDEWLESDIPCELSFSASQALIRALTRPLSMSDAIDFNVWVKKNEVCCFREKLRKLIGYGASVTKRGIKIQ